MAYRYDKAVESADAATAIEVPAQKAAEEHVVTVVPLDSNGDIVSSGVTGTVAITVRTDHRAPYEEPVDAAGDAIVIDLATAQRSVKLPFVCVSVKATPASIAGAVRYKLIINSAE